LGWKVRFTMVLLVPGANSKAPERRPNGAQGRRTDQG
jgi:hypothetical protein